MQIIECGQAMDMDEAVEWDSGAYRITIYLRYFGFMNYTYTFHGNGFAYSTPKWIRALSIRFDISIIAEIAALKNEAKPDKN